MAQIDLLTITVRRAEVLNLVARHQTQTQIAAAMDIAPSTVKSYIGWCREHADLSSMRHHSPSSRHSRKDWLCELATAAGLEVGVEHSLTGEGDQPIKMGPLGGLTQ